MIGQGLRGKRAVVIGANPSAYSLVRFLLRQSSSVRLIDSRKPELLHEEISQELDLTKIEFLCGPDLEQKYFLDADFIIVLDQTPMDQPVLEMARSSSIQVYTELEFVSLHATAPFIAVVGTKGKSSTAHILSQLLMESGKSVFSNVYQPLPELLNSSQNFDYAVVAANSFQLEGTSSFKPNAVLFLNLVEDHADRYPNFEVYLAANREVFRNIDEQSTIILNSQDPQVIAFAHSLPGRKLLFGTQTVPEGFEGAWANAKFLNVRIREHASLLSFELKDLRLRGAHNRDNLMAAMLTALSLGVSPELIREKMNEIRTLPGRLQFVRRINSVAFYNDSASTHPIAIRAGLQSFREAIILISGGRDRGIDYSAIAPDVRQRVKNLILVGESKEKLNRALGDFTETFIVGTLEEAVLMAYQKSRSGDVVLFSPGCGYDVEFPEQKLRCSAFDSLVGQISRPRRPNVI